ncbi:MAG TPA: MBOAT family O-acyltransferase [Bryobacteraceae bacterium]|jgi:D-alanyl-lipoteichoic acid acyltransferase DltB (MBOAT superfamily)|nr:MBOAT family O-acyltransferase [Bryobacteraceae bacterium]
MLFNTFSFAIFFAVTCPVFFLLPSRFQRGFLLAASYYFYMCWSVPYIGVIIAITLIDYCAGIAIEEAHGARRRLFLTLSILSNFGLLFAFKYADFFSAMLHAGIPQLHWLLPVGISFHTFQAVSYTVEVYRGSVRAERNLLSYALYVAFFPQMVAGPIERPGHLLPQLHQPKNFDFPRLRSGLRLALWGLIKKSMVADLVAPLVNTVYARPRDFAGPMLALATLLFAVQIFCDFSGYSDMAVGLARILGYDLTMNFRHPYSAKDIAGFWRRWHISLSTWFRDYLYIPLGGNRVSALRWGGVVLLVFLVSGLWHGANWTFVVWGGLHGLYLLGGAMTRPLRLKLATISGLARLPRLWALERIITTNLLVGIAWIFFRAKSVSDGVYVVSHLCNLTGNVAGFQPENLFRAGLPRFELALVPLAAFVVFCGEYLREHRPRICQLAWNRRPVRWLAYAGAIYSVVFFGVFQHLEFIYFQF